MKRFSHFNAEKITFGIIIIIIIIWCNNIFDTNTLSKENTTKLKNYGKFQGWGVVTSTTYSVEWKFQGWGVVTSTTYSVEWKFQGWGVVTSTTYSVEWKFQGGGNLKKNALHGVYEYFLELHNNRYVQYFTDCFSVVPLVMVST